MLAKELAEIKNQVNTVKMETFKRLVRSRGEAAARLGKDSICVTRDVIPSCMEDVHSWLTAEGFRFQTLEVDGQRVLEIRF